MHSDPDSIYRQQKLRNIMKQNRWRNYVKEEWLLLAAFAGLVVTSLYLRRLPEYSLSDAEILYTLFVLFIIIAGLQEHGAISSFAYWLQRGRFVAVKNVAGTFITSMFITNDVAFLALVPLTLLLDMKHVEWLVILEILAANAGSALSPIGNPQNLYIY